MLIEKENDYYVNIILMRAVSLISKKEGGAQYAPSFTNFDLNTFF